MTLRHFIAATLGALLQVSLLGVGMATSAPADKDCAPSHCCCSGKASCPCVKSGEGRKPAPPAIPASQEQLNPLIVPTDLESTGFVKSTDPACKPSPFPLIGDFHGYRGVALHVSFCRFTI